MARRKRRKLLASSADRQCIEFTSRTSLHISEEGIGATFRNPRRKELRKVTYDKCYFQALKGGRADYIVGYDRKIDVIIELKGSDLRHAQDQVSETLERWRTDTIHFETIVCLIVFGHTYPRMTSRIGSMERDFLERNNALLWIRASAAERFSFRKLAGK
jgi:hypothetical protein